MEKFDFKKRGEDIKKRSRQKSVIPEPVKRIYEFPGLISMGSLLTKEFPESKWVVEKLIPHQGITIIAGAPGNFKTWLLLLVAISITKGEKFLGNFQCTQSKVLIIDEEDHLRVLKERAIMLGADEDTPIYFLSQQGFSVENETWIKKVLDICEQKKIDVIFFDSLVRIHKGDENDSSTMSAVFKHIKKFCQAGKTVVITHHERKEGSVRSSGQNRLRGSSDISAALDSHISMRRDKDGKNILIVEQPKSRYDQESEPFEVSFIKEDDKMLFTFVGAHSSQVEKNMLIEEAIITILKESQEKISTKIIIERVTDEEKVGEKAVRAILKKLVENKVVYSEKGRRNERICSLPV